MQQTSIYKYIPQNNNICGREKNQGQLKFKQKENDWVDGAM